MTVQDLTSAKTIQLRSREIIAHEIKFHAPSMREYFIALREDGRQIVFCHAGIAFAPDFTSTGPIPDAPQVASLADYHTLRSNLESLISENRKQEALVVFNILISILDGARFIGLDISNEEEELDKRLSEFEKSMTKPA